MALDEARLKPQIIALWRKGGGDTLVKVMPAGVIPAVDRQVGYCTTIKFILGCTPLDMEQRVGLRDNSKLQHGADVFLVTLPGPADFSFRGHSNTPEGISTAIKPAHPDYPPGLGVPQWEVHLMQAAALKLLATVRSGESFRYRVATLPAT